MKKAIKLKETAIVKSGPSRQLKNQDDASSHKNTVKAWAAEIESLLDVEFETWDEARGAFIDKVVKKMSSADDDRELRKFLENILSLDVSLQTELKQLLKIKH